MSDDETKEEPAEAPGARNTQNPGHHARTCAQTRWRYRGGGTGCKHGALAYFAIHGSADVEDLLRWLTRRVRRKSLRVRRKSLHETLWALCRDGVLERRARGSYELAIVARARRGEPATFSPVVDNERST